MPGDSILSTRNITRQFGVVRALDDVSIDLQRGEVHCIVGENGAGKSTLMKILSGVDRPDSGQVLLRGQPVNLQHPADAQRMGISMIHQELNLVDELSVTDNIFLGREKTHFGLIDSKAMCNDAARLLSRVRCDVSPSEKVGSLSVAQKQLVEIAKAISIQAAVLIMDEPTAVLSAKEVSALCELVDQLRRDGVAIVYISHLLPEVLKLCDRLTVMRDGRVVETMDRAKAREIGERGIASRMVGRPMADHFPQRLPPGSDIAIEVRNLCVPGKINDLSFTVNHGEILGFAGLIGAGRTELAEAICGLRAMSAGTVLIDGEPMVIRNVRDAMRAGLAYLSEDRKGTGLTLGMSIAANTTLASLKHLLIDRQAEKTATTFRVNELQIKIGDIRDPVSSLSGGNQQKVALAKWLETHPRVLFIDEPTRGVDIGAKEQIYRIIQSLTQKGMACILISSELNEVIGLSHRIAVMRGGKIALMMNATAATEEAIMHAASGINSAGNLQAAS